jgi:hypothetical protein
MSPVVEHLEHYLGRIQQGWGPSEDGSIQIVRFANRPHKGVSTYATLGLSDQIKTLGGRRKVRMELVFSARDGFASEDVASFLLTFAEFVSSKKEALLRGDVVGPSEPLIAGVSANAVYAAIPVMFDKGFEALETTEPTTVFVWLLPLVGDEPERIRGTGWEPFEDALEQAQIDLFDLNRSSVFGQRA